MNGTIARTPALPRDSHDRAVYVWASGRYPDVQVTWDDPIYRVYYRAEYAKARARGMIASQGG